MDSQFYFKRPKSFTLLNQNTQNSSFLNAGKWTTQENLKYAIFMDFHKVTLSSRQKKKLMFVLYRNFRVFEQMAAFIGSRNTVQCRSHHQKLQERFKNFKKIISAVKNQIGRKDYKLQYKKLTNSGSALVIQPPQIQEKITNCKQSTEKQIGKQEEVAKPVEIKFQETFYPQTMYPFVAYSSFPGVFGFHMPGMYPFAVPYFG